MTGGVRYWSAVALLAAATLALNSLSHGERITPRQRLDDFPMVLADWTGQEFPIEQRLVDAVAVDDHLSRSYVGPDQATLVLYIGYYRSQRAGSTIHSPKNCLPGTGWYPVSSEILDITATDGSSVPVNLYVIQKGLDRQVVLYWYQSHGRTIASEYQAKGYMMLDSIRLNRTDGALVRVVTPEAPGHEAAVRRARKFAEAVLQQLDSYVPR